jgi:hypothetical protein
LLFAAAGVFFNEKYKIIYMRNRKTASTSTKVALDMAMGCSKSQRQNCLTREVPPEFEDDYDAAWKRYTVRFEYRFC